MLRVRIKKSRKRKSRKKKSRKKKSRMQSITHTREVCSDLQCVAICCSMLQNHVSSILKKKEGRGILRANTAQNSIHRILRLPSARGVLQ